MNTPALIDKDHILAILDEAYQSRINDLDKSIQLTNQALSLSRDSEEHPLIARSLSHLSLFYMILGENEQSMTMAREAIRIFTELGDDKGIADAKYNIAGLYYKTDNFHSGLIYLLDCLAIYRKYRDFHNMAKVLKSIGTIYEFFGDQKSAVKSYESSIQAARKSKNIDLESNAYNPLSGIYLNQNRIEKALETIEKSIAMKKESGDVRGLAFALYGRGKVFTKTGEFEKAEKDFLQSIDIHVDMGEKIGLGMTYHKLGVLYLEMGEIEQAKATLGKALDFGNKHNIALVKYKTNFLLYRIYKQEGNLSQSLRYLEDYIAVKEVVVNTQTFRVIESYEAINKIETMEMEAQLKREKAEIMEKKDLAEKASKMKEDFLSTMSHEIRTPLNAVITIANLLEDRSSKDDRQLLDSLKFSANNLLLIINDILDFTKLNSGKVTLDQRPVDFIKFIDSIRNTYDSLAREKGLKLLSHISSKVYSFYKIDKVKLSQILGNLISNAIKFTDKGQIEVFVKRLEAGNEKDIVRFEVTDSGVGIAKSDMESIFDSFSQLRQPTTRSRGGSGLGLAIVKKLLGLHGAEVTVRSVVGQGSSFVFDLHLARCGAPIKSIEKYSDRLVGKKVLMADDMMINAMVAAKLLSSWGMIIEHVDSGSEVVEKSKSQTFDFILMDIHMPGMDGFEATRQIRENDNPNKKTPIFALTADINAEQRKKYRSYFNGFLLKPIEREKLYEAFIGTL